MHTYIYIYIKVFERLLRARYIGSIDAVYIHCIHAFLLTRFCIFHYCRFEKPIKKGNNKNERERKSEWTGDWKKAKRAHFTNIRKFDQFNGISKVIFLWFNYILCVHIFFFFFSSYFVYIYFISALLFRCVWKGDGECGRERESSKNIMDSISNFDNHSNFLHLNSSINRVLNLFPCRCKVVAKIGKVKAKKGEIAREEKCWKIKVAYLSTLLQHNIFPFFHTFFHR